MNKKLFNPLNGKEVSTPEDVVKLWVQVKKKKKEVDELSNFCKSALNFINVPIGTPVHKNMGLERKERRNISYDKSIIRSIVQDEDTVELLTSIDKKKLKGWYEENGGEFKKEIEEKAVFEESKPTVFFQLKKY
jgi:hypothetical protein